VKGIGGEDVKRHARCLRSQRQRDGGRTVCRADFEEDSAGGQPAGVVDGRINVGTEHATGPILDLFHHRQAVSGHDQTRSFAATPMVPRRHTSIFRLVPRPTRQKGAIGQLTIVQGR
jgi:hypothetical protein